MKTKILGTVNEEGEYNILESEEENFILETIDEKGNIILNYIDEE